jgi:hypothetical protein
MSGAKVLASRQAGSAEPMRPEQSRRLEALWRRWAEGLRLPAEEERMLRHDYVRLLSEGRAGKTNELSAADAARVIRGLERLIRAREPARNLARGTAGRHGFPERARVRPDASAWRALWACATALGMDRARLDSFIRRRYGRFGLCSTRDLTTMAELNRVLWGLKAMLRRRRPAMAREKKAA